MPKEKKKIKEESPPTKIEKKDTKIELLRKWKRRVAIAKEIRKKWEDDYEVEKCERYYLGQQWEKTQGTDKLVLNHLWATIKTQKPNLFYTNPKFFVRSKPGRTTPVEDRHAATGEGVLEAIGNQDQCLKRAGSLGVLQAFFRAGILKIVFDPRMESNPRAGEPIYLTTETGEPIIDPSTGIPVSMKNSETGMPLIEPDEVMTDEAFRYEWVDAANMLFPDAGPDRSKWTWIGEEVIVPISEAKKDTRFSKKFRDQLEANDWPTNWYPSDTDTRREEGMLRYFECYDIKEKRVAIWADGQKFEDFLYEDSFSPGIEDHPYAILPGWTPIIGPEPSPWPMPHVKPWLPVQNEYNIRRQQITEGAKRSARKVLFDDATFPDADEAAKQLQSSADMEAVRVNDVTRPPVVIVDKDLNPSIYRDIPFLQQDWYIITGQTGARMAKAEDVTATEASFVERAGNLRDADMQDAINDWLSEAGKKMFQMVKANLTLELWIKMRGFTDKEFQEYAVRVYGVEPAMLSFLPGLKETFKERFGQEKWVRVTREDLQFEADVTVVPGSSRPRNLEVERNQWLTFLRIIGQFPQLALSRELLRETAAKFEYISERMLDELTVLAQKMIEVSARQAGRTQGAGDGSSMEGSSMLANLLAAATGGRQ